MRLWVLGTVFLLVGAAAQANTIQRACLTSDRAINPRLGSCIQAAADRTLTRRDQKVAASFFADPDRAEEMRMSKRQNHEAFWERYKAFGAFAASVCS